MTHHAAPASVSLPVKGMTCAACSTRLEKVLGKVDGVAEASVSLASEQADIRYDPAATSPADLARAVERAGFSVPEEEMELSISGMTCAACSTRLEKVLGKVSGVSSAQVNLAAERARVTFVPGSVAAADLVAAVEKAGFGARLVTGADEQWVREEAEHARAMRRQLLMFTASALLTLPLVAMMAGELLGIHALMLDPWAQWVLATPVQFWIGWRFYDGAWKSLRGGAGNMDVLVALGTSAAYFLSA
ncbi:MAG: copper ion binding protein, partial [Pseudomonadota bacterium]